MALRICLVTPFSWSQPHDVNEHVSGIARELRARGHAVTVVAPSGRASELLAGRRDWWFQGRELIEALSIRLVAAGGDVADAAGIFDDALARTEAHDHYAVVWLAGECAGALRGASAAVDAAVDRLAIHARALGYQPVLDRLLAASRPARPDLRAAS